MANEIITGIVIRGDRVEWGTFASTQEKAGEGRTGEVSLEEADGAPADLLKAGIPGDKGAVVAGLTSGQVLLRVVELPLVDDEEELKGMVELQADKFSPFPIENMVVSHEILRSEGEMSTVLVAAAKRDTVESMGELLDPAGMRPFRVDSVVLGWWRLLNDAGLVSESAKQVTVLMDGITPEIIVSDSGVPTAFRSLGETQGLAVDEIADEIAREVGYTLMSLELEYGSSEASSVDVWYGSERIEGLSDRLKEECSCEVSERYLTDLPSITKGLAQRAMGSGKAGLDLLPPTWRTEQESQLYKKQILTTGGAILGVWAVCALVFFGGLFFQIWTLSKMKADEERGRGPAMEVSDIRERVRTLRLYTDSSRSALACLREASRLKPQPDDVVVWKSYDFKKEKSAKIEAVADSEEALLEYIKNLNTSKLFAEVIPGSQIYDRRTRKIKFSITLKLPEGEEE